MKYKTVLKNLTLFMLMVCMVIVSVFCANAVDGQPDIDSQVESQEEVQQETIPEPETDVVPEATENPAEEQTETPTEESEQVEPETDNTDNYVEETIEEQQPEAEETQVQVQENEQENNQSETIQTKTLPTVAPTTEKKIVNKDDLTYGYVSWSCVAAGILVLLIVFISIKASGKKQSRRKRR